MRVLHSRLLSALGVPHAFSLRAGGVSKGPFASLNLGGAVGDDPADVEENLRLFVAAAGIAPGTLGTVAQVHGDRVVHARATPGTATLHDGASSPALEGRVEADAVVAAPGAAAGVRTADCVPILLYDPASGAAAAVHAGWRGTAAKIVVRAVEAMVGAHAARPANLRAAIGPAIGRCCYEVGEDLARRFSEDPAFGPSVVGRETGTAHLDLPRANRALLEAAGLEPGHIDDLGACTACDSALFFSHRRDQGRTGRHLAVIAAGRFGVG